MRFYNEIGRIGNLGVVKISQENCTLDEQLRVEKLYLEVYMLIYLHYTGRN